MYDNELNEICPHTDCLVRVCSNACMDFTLKAPTQYVYQRRISVAVPQMAFNCYVPRQVETKCYSL